jgi:flagellar motor switch protein FliM
MDLAILDAQELEAIRSALGQAAHAPVRTRDPSGAEDKATPIALIADDRSAERARPDGLKLAQRWAHLARMRLMRLTGIKIEIDGSSAEISDASTIKEQLAGCWTSCVVVRDRPGRGLVAVSGPMVEGLSARLLGGADASGSERPPSPTALRVFTPAGEAVVSALLEAWREEQMCEVRATPETGDEWRRGLGDSDILVVATLSVSGATTGRVRLVVPPDTLLMPPPALKVVPASAATIRAVLGEVPVEVRADLGRATVTMSELAALKPGAVVILDRAVGDPLPVYCADQRVGSGRALVARGCLAVKIVHPSEEEK